MNWRDYECAALEFANDRPRGRGGVEYGGVGHVNSVTTEHGIITFDYGELPEARSASQELSGIFLQGFGTRYSKAHVYDRHIEVIAPGAFARTLATKAAVRFLIGHDEARLVATSADRLELLSNDVGLAFRLSLTYDDGELIREVKSGARDGMSVAYRVECDEWRTIDGVKFRMITDATLLEISAVHRGAVKEAYVTLVDASMRL
jgi:HK97 family phage prohead protease